MSYEFNFENKKNEFYKYLYNNYQVSNNTPTHTSIGEPPGSWHINDDCIDYFYKYYSEICFKFNIDVHLTEKHKMYSPVLIDLDFRYPEEHPNRIFDFTFIKNIILLYNKVIQSCYKNITSNNLESYVLLKANSICDNNSKKIKDGIHIIYPYLVTKPDIQKYFRRCILTTYKNELKEIFSSIHCTNDFSDIFDDKVIYDTNWQLYGSKKPGNIPYKLKYVCDINGNIIKKNLLEDNISINHELVKLFSIRNKSETKLILNFENDKMDKWLKENSEQIINKITSKSLSKKQIKRSIEETKIFGKSGNIENLDYIKDLVETCLSVERANNFDSWIKCGILLHNIDYKLLDTWITFSKKSPKYKINECEEKWDTLPVSSSKNTSSVNGELSIGTLIYWAKQDNLEQYNTIYNKYNKDISANSTLYKLLYKSAGAAHTDVANVIYRYFNGFGLSEEIQFMCYNITKKLWCEYKPNMHRWIEDTEENSGHCIRHTFDIEIYRLYAIEYDQYISDKLKTAIESGDEEQAENLTKHKEKVFKLANQLKVTSYRDTLLKECCNRFILKGCRDLLDTNLDLISFTNGVYDLENSVFRKGRPSDYISISTHLEYTDYTYDSPEIIELINIISQILPIKPVREYFLHILSSCLSGKQWFEKFFVLTGSGSNGKSKLIELIQNTLGEYAHQMNVSALCSKRGASNAADPELAMLRGRRFVTFQEPSKDEPINVGKLKEWTGGDTIQCRELYKGPIKFKSQAKWFLICNDIPDVPSDDDGTWRRLTVINFPSKFISKAEMTGRDYEYERINDMKDKLEQLKEPFMWLLLDYYKSFQELMKTTGLVEPPEIIESTNNERKKNNPIKQFIDDRIRYTDDKKSKFTVTEIYNAFKNFMTDSGHHTKFIPKRNEFSAKFNIEYVNIIKKYGKKTIEINKNKMTWCNVYYLTDSVDNKNDHVNNIIESDSDNENIEDNSFSHIEYESELVDSGINYDSD
jgi:P4 family phage/plasmid primase-like protien